MTSDCDLGLCWLPKLYLLLQLLKTKDIGATSSMPDLVSHSHGLISPCALSAKDGQYFLCIWLQ